jgi:hypothetical protein
MSGYPLPANSRYLGIQTLTWTDAEGHPVLYFSRRFLPDPDTLALLQTHTVNQGERLDHLAQYFYGDAELFWRIADANRAMDPGDLTVPPGRSLRITLPEGIPGAPHA